MAALVVTVPRRVEMSCVVDKIVNVVPKLVALRAAPAENACNGVAETNSIKMKDNPIGAAIPVKATVRERKTFALSDAIEVDKPPS
jgi:hypothetical protein